VLHPLLVASRRQQANRGGVAGKRFARESVDSVNLLRHDGWRNRSNTILFAPGFNGRGFGEIRREIIGVKRFDVQFDEAEQGDVEVHFAVGAIHDHGDAEDVALVSANDVDGFLCAAAFGDDVLDDQNLFARGDFETAAKNEFPFLFLDKDEAQAELARHFLANDEAAHGRGDDGGRAEGADFISEGVAELFDRGHVLEGKSALKELAAAKAAAKDEVAFEQSARVAKNLESVGFSHWRGW